MGIVCLTATAMGQTGEIGDKTLVAWASPAPLDQEGGGSVLTIDDRQNGFDAIVFAELAPRRWMPGSENWRRTARDQDGWPQENTGPDRMVQIAVVYEGAKVTAYRNGAVFAQYTHEHPRSFPPDSMVLFGARHVQNDRFRGPHFRGVIKDARIYAEALDAETIAQLVPGESGGPDPWAWWAFCKGDLIPDRTGRFGDVHVAGDVRLTRRGLELRGAAPMLLAYPGAAVPSVPRARSDWQGAGAVPDHVVRDTRRLRERLLADPRRPTYHFAVPEDWGRPGDANGAFYANGRYHLMYLYARKESGFCWGHISSRDLVHWRHHPDAIGPDEIDEGCFSGGAFVDDDGAAYLSYWMLHGARGLGLARSDDPHYDRFVKLPQNPVIASTEWGLTETTDADGNPLVYGSADPTNIWKTDGVYYMAAGNLLVLNKYGRGENAPAHMQGDWLDLFRSTDLINWEYMHRLYERNPDWTDRSEDNMCPSFLPLPSRPDGGPPSGKHLLLFIAHNRGAQYYIGSYRDDRFLLERHGRMSWVDNTYFAPEALVDDRGRQIMWAWLTDNPGGEEQQGWSGVFGLPRTLWLGEDGDLRMAPVPELEVLRARPQAWEETDLAPGDQLDLAGVTGDACELRLTLRPATDSRCGVKVRCSPDGEEVTRLYYDAAAGDLVFDATRSGTDGRRVVERAPFRLRDGEQLQLRVFVDRTVVEVYANDRQAICRRVYPGRDDSLGVAVFAEHAATTVVAVSAWEMMPANPY